ncbi:GNAT family N-acetyltransferase [Erysipelothrix sp. HDW6C]|uniref:GNAT family N-acetyltransferase n=1 Tax=Erysipelothrix sp. HDW6C TaxID=2714930 RepID=UPI0014094865|nr:GNAT family N-acetyltransferase [Erysipelothrix sp. HDW6C]QIK70609.1 GNAT family N-acetyltransferase [Erysipelothrix sp. HDW6C]
MDLLTINEENFAAVLKCEVSPEQAKYVAPNVKSLAECYLYRNDGVMPFALSVNGTIVGFALLDIDDEERDVTIWRIMIDHNHQNKGYGRQAIEKISAWVIINTPYRDLYIDYVLGNEQAKHLYEKMGFQPVRINEHGEQVMMRTLEKKGEILN